MSIPVHNSTPTTNRAALAERWKAGWKVPVGATQVGAQPNLFGSIHEFLVQLRAHLRNGTKSRPDVVTPPLAELVLEGIGVPNASQLIEDWLLSLRFERQSSLRPPPTPSAGSEELIAEWFDHWIPRGWGTNDFDAFLGSIDRAIAQAEVVLLPPNQSTPNQSTPLFHKPPRSLLLAALDGTYLPPRRDESTSSASPDGNPGPNGAMPDRGHSSEADHIPPNSRGRGTAKGARRSSSTSGPEHADDHGRRLIELGPLIEKLTSVEKALDALRTSTDNLDRKVSEVDGQNRTLGSRLQQNIGKVEATVQRNTERLEQLAEMQQHLAETQLVRIESLVTSLDSRVDLATLDTVESVRERLANYVRRDLILDISAAVSSVTEAIVKHASDDPELRSLAADLVKQLGRFGIRTRL